MTLHPDLKDKRKDDFANEFIKKKKHASNDREPKPNYRTHLSSMNYVKSLKGRLTYFALFDQATEITYTCR